MVFTNFVLLPQFSNDPIERQKGYSWYGPIIAGILAALYFILKVFERMGDRIEAAPDWWSALGIIAFICLIPAAMQINRLNIGREDIIAKNSGYHWTTIVFILMFLPIFILLLIGTFM